MTQLSVLIVVEGLFEKSDSIGYDAVYQFRQLQAKEHLNVRLFAARYDREHYPDLPIEDAALLSVVLPESANAVLIYHFCDGWPAFEDLLARFTGRLVVRWHNNTPPWFFGRIARHSLERTTRGFRAILRLSRRSNVEFWCNSAFTCQQMRWLGAGRVPTSVVYPASRYLLPRARVDGRSAMWSGEDSINVLFVGRVVAHKGFAHMIVVAAHLKRIVTRPIELVLVGRAEAGANMHLRSLQALAQRLDVPVRFVGEVSESELEEHYRRASVFLCLSQHEGFGMPIYEAMRLNVPIVAWSGTAIAELMHGHPTVYDDFDIRRFASGIAAITTVPGADQALANWQNRHVLPRYTAAVVASQLEAALAGALLPAEQIQSRPSMDGPSFDECDGLKSAEEAHYRRLLAMQQLTLADFDLPLEPQNNFVTLYDIETLESLLNPLVSAATVGDPPNASGAGLRSSTTGASTAYVGHRQFSVLGDTVYEEHAVVPLSTHVPHHIVFGPHLRVLPGRYRVEFELYLSPDAADEAGALLFLDVYDGKVLAQSTVECGEANRTKKTLEFSVESAETFVEFRVFARGFVRGHLIFRGAALRRLPLKIDEGSASGRERKSPTMRLVESLRAKRRAL
ncbi:glycosyltransferase family 4 protein [Reyranella sp.]|uniref:glycosyltransferase family 4 protein n=1 Tax=Reyranella sp. TaxID=1929291 RepID=UPI003C7A930D